MGEAITIKKKKKLTIKSKSENAEPDNSPSLSDVLPTLAPTPVVAPGPSYTAYAILAVITTLMFIGILAMQYFEFDFLSSAFPRPLGM